MQYLCLFFLVQGWRYYAYHYISFLPKSCSLTEASTRRCLKPNCSISLRSVNKLRTCLPATIVRQVAVTVQIWESSSLFVTCLHFCLAPWYLCTCKSFFWYMLACLSTSLKSRHVHVNCPVHADHHNCKVPTNAGTEVEIPTLGRRALPPHLKKKIHFSPHIFILNCSSGWKYALDVCSMCSEIGTFANVGCARQRSRGVARRKMVTIIFISISIDLV